MSFAYKIAAEIKGKKLTPLQFRKFLQRPGRVDSVTGARLYRTEQAHKKTCDINHIIKKYDKTGLINHVSKIEAKFGDMTGVDFQNMNNKVFEIKQMFAALPSEIRKEFSNSPTRLLSFMDDPNNRDKAIKLGLIRQEWTPETDGLGEHIKSDADRKTVENGED